MGSDREDFSAFVAGNATRLLQTAYLLTGERAAAEDLLQDALERTYVAWPRIDEPTAYVRTALARHATNRWRRRSRRPEVPLDSWHDRPDADHSQATIDRVTVREALTALPARQRAVVVLRFLEDLSEAETARCLGCSVGTVKSHTFRALARLRSVLYVDGESSAQGMVEAASSVGGALDAARTVRAVAMRSYDVSGGLDAR